MCELKANAFSMTVGKTTLAFMLRFLNTTSESKNPTKCHVLSLFVPDSYMYINTNEMKIWCDKHV